MTLSFTSISPRTFFFFGISIFLCLFVDVSQVEAQTNSKNTKELRIPSDERLQEIHLNPDYYYFEDVQEIGLWQRFLMWLSKILGEWINLPIIAIVLRWISIIAIILVILLLLNQILDGQLKSAITRRRDRTFLDIRTEGKKISNAELDRLLNKAIIERNFSLAVRYLYQKSLISLRNKELIQWKQDKTNHEYLYELGEHPAALPFDRLTYFYEYVDYGDFPIDEHRFAKIQKVYNEFITKIGDQK